MAKVKTGGELRSGSRRLAMWAVIGVILLAPLVAMQVTREVDWTPGDFAVAAILLGGGGAAYELAGRRVHNYTILTAIAVAIVLVVALLWAQGAVGIV